MKEHLKHAGYQTAKSYTEYLGWITKRTGMRGKAVDMFNQTVAVKDIQSLNEFIRKHMLESQNWREKIQRLLTHFNDLSTRASGVDSGPPAGRIAGPGGEARPEVSPAG